MSKIYLLILDFNYIRNNTMHKIDKKILMKQRNEKDKREKCNKPKRKQEKENRSKEKKSKKWKEISEMPC